MTHSWHLVSRENISHALKSASPGYPSALAFRVNRTVLLLAISRGQPQYGFGFHKENWFRSSADLIKSRVIEIDFFFWGGDTDQSQRFMIQDKRFLLAGGDVTPHLSTAAFFCHLSFNEERAHMTGQFIHIFSLEEIIGSKKGRVVCKSVLPF